MNEEKAKQLAQLIYLAPISKEVKEAILSNLSHTPAVLVEYFIDSLQEGVDQFTDAVAAFFKEQDGRWSAVEEKQRSEADRIIREEVEKVKQKCVKAKIENKI